MVLYQHRFSGFFFVSLFALNLRHFVLPLQHYPQFHSRRAPPRPVLSNLQGACHQRFCACSSRSPKKSRNRRESKIENLKCTAVVLTSCSTSSVSDDNNGATDHNTSSDQPTSTRHLVNVLGFTDEKDGNSDSDSDARTVIGDLVLSDWLDVLPRSRRDSEETAHKREFPTEDHERLNLVSYVEDGSPANVRRKRTVRSSLESIEGDTEDSAPFKFQQLIQRIWAELSRGDQLAYLDAAGQARVKGALTVLAAYGALREHPLHTGVISPQQAFSQMDFNSDGEISFDEFVRWYSMSSALDKPRQSSQDQGRQHLDRPAGGTGYMNPNLQTPEEELGTRQVNSAADSTLSSPQTTTLAHASNIATALAPKTTGGTSRLIADLKGLVHKKRPRGSGKEAPSSGHSLAHTKSTFRRGKSEAVPGAHGSDASPPSRALDRRSAARVSGRSGAARKGSEWPVIFTPSPNGGFWVEGSDVTGGRVITEAEKNECREIWLASGAVKGGKTLQQPPTVERSASEDFERALDVLCVLVKAGADADTLIAALASCMIRNPTGWYDLEAIEEQFGPIIKGIVEDRLLLERIPEPPSAESQRVIRQSRGVKAVLDLDDYHAKLMREYLVHSSKDARAVVVHMADLTCRLREAHRIPVYAVQSLALEALQLYVPVSNALGLGSSFRELEELGYKTLFPQTFATLSLWHQNARDKGHSVVLDVKRRILQALGEREGMVNKVKGYRIYGRTKGLVSTFRKVFRQNKRVTDVHDIIGLRIIVDPADGDISTRTSNGQASALLESISGSSSINQKSADGKPSRDIDPEGPAMVAATEDPMKASGSEAPGRVVGYSFEDNGETDTGERYSPTSSPSMSRALLAFTYKTLPPPYRDSDSRLLHDVYEVVVGLFEEVPGRYKNYVDFPKANGYRSVHTTVTHGSGLMIELQVRTAKMHAEAEEGGAAHSLYKGDLGNPDEASIFRSKMTPSHRRPALEGTKAKTSRLGSSGSRQSFLEGGPSSGIENLGLPKHDGP